MQKRAIIILLAVFGLLWQSILSPVVLFAQEGPSNNKFGIHIAKPHDEDIEDAAKLVNGNGGSWGYVTMVMQEDERDVEQWQNRFDKLRELKLIPIIRLATKPEGGNWRRPTKEDAGAWADFLATFNWPVKDRYIILFNEPNHATEWGGSVDPKNYAEVAKEFATEINKRHPDFVVMMAGLDAAAPSASPTYEDSGVFMRSVVENIGKDDFNNLFKGFASHSYPNPGFVGSPFASGKGTIRSYIWELATLQELGVKELPVFITETGWNADAIGREGAADNFVYAYEQVWIPDARVKAVTPFILNYQGEPFLKFSWRKFESKEFYPQYDKIKEIKKVIGEPQINERGRIRFDMPSELVEDSNYHFMIQLENNGQGYWDKDHQYKLILKGTDGDEYLFSDIYKIKPRDSGVVDLYFKTDKPTAAQVRQIQLLRNDEPVLQSSNWRYIVLPLPSLKIQSKFFPKANTTSDMFEIQIFDENEEIVYKKKHIDVKDGVGYIESLRNIAFNKNYRVVLLHRGYLPRQTYVKFGRGTNEIIFERMLPFDLNGDGELTFGDIWYGVNEPKELNKFLP